MGNTRTVDEDFSCSLRYDKSVDWQSAHCAGWGKNLSKSLCGRGEHVLRDLVTCRAGH